MTQSLRQNLWYGLRLFRRNPGLTLTGLLTLTLGIGANTAIFTVAYATLLAPLPYPGPDQLVTLWSVTGANRSGVSAGDLADWRRRSTVLQDLNAWSPNDFNIAT